MPATKQGDLFREIADKIDRNPETDFGGAFIIVPPDGEPVSGILVGAPDLGVFWGAVKLKCDKAVDTIDDKQRQQQQFRR